MPVCPIGGATREARGGEHGTRTRVYITGDNRLIILKGSHGVDLACDRRRTDGDLVLLFACLRLYERAPAQSSTREQLKVAVWILTTLLTFAFSYKVAAVMPPSVAVLVWLMAFATVAGGFFAFFLYKEKN
ncbi:hypothetical protein PR202_ga06903 [Eleusine coracana subsp. coracana]|uniref:Uncharacterized protein n=1 Tax=Eleusine coracana subsp. coracana TaxID=191504 RepID=A0AAV5BYE4_ELECO|nr:hypothetical protein PR202_ga06903 [Eleusine coracana subsp. coracana]